MGRRPERRGGIATHINPMPSHESNRLRGQYRHSQVMHNSGLGGFSQAQDRNCDPDWGNLQAPLASLTCPAQAHLLPGLGVEDKCGVQPIRGDCQQGGVWVPGTVLGACGGRAQQAQQQWRVHVSSAFQGL